MSRIKTHRHQCHFNWRPPHQRHIFWNERYRLFRVVEGSCRHFTQLVASPDTENKEIIDTQSCYSAFTETADELIRWYDREDHTNFDVCADDHCQRYQGITRASTEIVQQAIQATRGQVLLYGDKICDARFSKCCGGAFEEFQYCWEDVKTIRIWLSSEIVKPFRSYPTCVSKQKLNNGSAPPWSLLGNTTDKKFCRRYLITTIRETTDFFRWKVTYQQEELSGTDNQTFGHRLRSDTRPDSHGTRYIGTTYQTQDRRDQTYSLPLAKNWKSSYPVHVTLIQFQPLGSTKTYWRWRPPPLH